MLKIVTDGAADMPTEWEKVFEINILPLRVNFGEETYIQGINLDNQKFYQLVKEKKIIPKTSLPSPNQIADFYRSIIHAGDEILSIHLASRMSGTFSAVQMAVKELAAEIKITAYDSGAGSAALGFMCRDARLLSRAGASVQEILARMDEVKKRLTVIFTLDTLDFALMNGRVNLIQSSISSLLKIKPIVELHNGLIGISEKVRTRQKAIERVLEKVHHEVGGRLVNIAIVHAQDRSSAELIKAMIEKVSHYKEIIITDLAVPVAANLGPGTVGIVAYPAD
jgi:DegV family protein with EDD domain